MRKLWLQARALGLVVAARILLRRRDTTSALRRLARPGRRVRPVQPEAALSAVRRAGRMAHATCLPQSVALVALLERGGGAPVLVLGCRRYPNREWGAHAWVEADDRVWEPVIAAAHQELAQMDSAHAWMTRGR